jgi:hypothetical protein
VLKPDQRQFEADLQSAAFRNGVLKGCWGIESTADLAWPKVALWIGAAARSGAPDRFHLMLDCEGYRGVPPTGTFWDPATGAMLAEDKRPRGKSNSRFSKVFRTDWEGGRAFYHPYDRVAAQSHPDWAGAQPHLVWHRGRAIVDCLEEYHALLRSEDYLGI